jgi:hypothetical protein
MTGRVAGGVVIGWVGRVVTTAGGAVRTGAAEVMDGAIIAGAVIAGAVVAGAVVAGAVVAGAAVGWPTLATSHSPPKLEMPWPDVSPGAPSREKR